MRDVTDLFTDLAAGTLPAVSYVKPDGTMDGHPASSKWTLFEAFVKNIIEQALFSSECLLVENAMGFRKASWKPILFDAKYRFWRYIIIMLDGVTLDQLRTLITAAEQGSFAAAGRKLQRAQSVVSQTLANLEGQLGVTLFDRSAATQRSRRTGARCFRTHAPSPIRWTASKLGRRPCAKGSNRSSRFRSM
jgi:hypothetical protein